jgi:hypothetical protein
MYLDPIPELNYNMMGVYLDTPKGSFRATPVPVLISILPNRKKQSLQSPGCPISY